MINLSWTELSEKFPNGISSSEEYHENFSPEFLGTLIWYSSLPDWVKNEILLLSRNGLSQLQDGISEARYREEHGRRRPKIIKNTLRLQKGTKDAKD